MADIDYVKTACVMFVLYACSLRANGMDTMDTMDGITPCGQQTVILLIRQSVFFNNQKANHRSFIMFGAVSVQMLYHPMETMDNMDRMWPAPRFLYHPELDSNVFFLIWQGGQQTVILLIRRLQV